MNRRALTNALAWAALGLAGPGYAAELQPHSAAYEVRLIKAAPSSQIEDARGAVRVDWRESCDAWTVEQRFEIMLAFSDGRTSRSSTVFRAVESKDGRNYEFSSRTDRDGELEESFAGKVERPTGSAAGSVIYSNPAGEKLPLPAGTLLPMQHMLGLLALAERGGGRLDAPYFDGPRPDNSPFSSNSIVGEGKRAAAAGSGPVKTAPFDRPWWPMQLAFFARSQRVATPDFEIAAEIQDNGIARLLSFDYGTMVISATAAAGELLPRPRC